jgi:hypothetical protein
MYYELKDADYESEALPDPITITDFKERSFKTLTVSFADLTCRISYALYLMLNDTTQGAMFDAIRNDALETYSKHAADPLLPFDASNFKDQELFNDVSKDITFFWYRKSMVLHTASAIYCTNPGRDTGIMMISAPQTGVCIDRSTEELKIPMRM